MPRTKVPKKNAANKRDQNSITEEAKGSLLRRLDECHADALMIMKLNNEQRLETFEEIMQDLRVNIPKAVLNLSMAEFANYNLAESNSTIDCGGGDKSAKKVDDGYITGESANTTVASNITNSSRRGRPIGPLASAKIKSRRSRSAVQDTTTNLSAKVVARSNTTVTSSHASRQKYRTPAATSRIQTMSADRGQMLNPITPKIGQNTPITFLRYQKMGETVISLQGSPIVMRMNNGDQANINIPIGDNILSMVPTAMTSNSDFNFSIVSQIDSATLEQLRMLQKNLKIIVNKASAN